MRRLTVLAFAIALVATPGQAQVNPGTSPLSVAKGGTGRATLTNHGVLVGAAAAAITQIAVPASGTLFQGVSGADPIWSATPTLGVAGTTVGTLSFANATSGSVKLQPVTGALGASVLSLPAATDTLVGKATTDTLTNKSLGGSTNTFTPADNKFTLQDDADATKQLNFQLSGITTGQMRTLTPPDASAKIAALDIEDQVLAGGANVTAKSLTTGSITVDCGARPLQFVTNNGAWTITAPASDGSCALLITNGATAATPTFSGFSVGANTGDALDNTNAHKFILQVMRINGASTYAIKALQ